MDNKNNALGQGSRGKGKIVIWLVFLAMSLPLYLLTDSLSDQNGVNSALIGYFLMVVNLFILALAWTFILKKKFIALTTPLIVLKYALLGLVLYFVVKNQQLDLTWFVVGFIWFFLSIIISGFIKSKLEG